MKIILAEDEPLSRDVLTSFRKSDGHSVAVADESQALQRVSENGSEMVITHSFRSRGEGTDLAKEIKTVKPEQKIVSRSGPSEVGQLPNFECVPAKPLLVKERTGLIRRICTA